MRPDNTKAVDTGKEVLGLIKKDFCEGAFIAGGWARDYILDLPIRDVDLWLPAIRAFKKEDLESKGFTKYRLITIAGDRRIDKIIKCSYKDMDVDMIYLKDPEEVFNGYTVCERFPFGIQQAFWEGDTEDLGFTEGFDSDVSARSITFNPMPCNLDNLLSIRSRALPKMIKKFPGHELIDPDSWLTKDLGKDVSKKVVKVEGINYPEFEPQEEQPWP